MDRRELGLTLRTWRARLKPPEVGLPAGTRRRTPGLRREEVAQLAGISVDYLVRLEQGRGPRPSQSVLDALGRALRLTEHEREQMFHLSGASLPAAGRLAGSVKPSVLRLLDRFGDLPAVLMDAKADVLAWNPLAAALLGDYSAWPPGQRNMIWQCFLGDAPRRVVMTPQERGQAEAHMVADLRAAAARYPDDPGVRRLVADLRAGSSRFERLWQQRGAAMRRSSRKRIEHPELGIVELDCDVLEVPDADQRLIVYSAAPGTPEAQALALLRVVGTQDLSLQPR
ncbi:MAG: helix-turn-helix domain-containing protein [Pseudonocardiales bacterium]|nr:helix-turn-helix domain-containing protein [Pseudonocardiales bacterium]